LPARVAGGMEKFQNFSAEAKSTKDEGRGNPFL